MTNDKTNFNCLYPDGKNCGKAIADIFVPQVLGLIANVAPKAQAKSDSVSARAARVSRPNTLKTNSGNSAGPDKAMGGSGAYKLTCMQEGCSLKCVTGNYSGGCWCERADGTECNDPVVQGQSQSAQ